MNITQRRSDDRKALTGRTITTLAAVLAVTFGAVAARAGILDGGGQPDPTFDGNSMLLWLRADSGLFDATTGGSAVTDGNPVARWEDKSTYGLEAAQGTGGIQPTLTTAAINGQPAVVFSANDRMGITSPFTGHQTAIIVYQDTSSVAWVTPLGTSYKGSRGGSYHGNDDATKIFNSDHTDSDTLDGTSFRNGFLVDGLSTPRPGASFVIDVHVAAEQLTQNVNMVGSDSCCFDRSINGGIAEILVYNQALSTSELNAIGNYLEGRYGVTWNDTTLPSGTLDLADIVGGGDGSKFQTSTGGIDKENGAQVTTHLGTFQTGAGFKAVTANSLVDGISIPDGGAGGGPVQYNTLGDTIVLPDTENKSWDHALNEPSQGGSSTLGGIDYNNLAGRTMIDVHASTLLTFDLAAIGTAHRGTITRFTAVAGCPNATSGSDMEFRVYLDGVQKASGTIDNTNRTVGFAVDIAVAPDDRFLTLVALDANDGIAHDQIIFGDPRLEIEPWRGTVIRWY